MPIVLGFLALCALLVASSRRSHAANDSYSRHLPPEPRVLPEPEGRIAETAAVVEHTAVVEPAPETVTPWWDKPSAQATVAQPKRAASLVPPLVTRVLQRGGTLVELRRASQLALANGLGRENEWIQAKIEQSERSERFNEAVSRRYISEMQSVELRLPAAESSRLRALRSSGRFPEEMTNLLKPTRTRADFVSAVNWADANGLSSYAEGLRVIANRPAEGR